MKNAECPSCKDLEAELEVKDKKIAENESAACVITSVKEKCAEYLNRPLALQDIPDVVCLRGFIIDLGLFRKKKTFSCV